jgi:hypothetical protein
MKHGYLIGLVLLLIVVLAFKTYEAFNASSGGALIQLATSHVPTSEEIHEARAYGMNNQEEDTNQKDAYNAPIDNSPYSSY